MASRLRTPAQTEAPGRFNSPDAMARMAASAGRVGMNGPSIPTLPALAAVRALASGELSRPGASVCAGVLSLDAIEREFARYRITTHVEFGSSGA